MYHKKYQFAFTLIEMLVVLALVGIVTGGVALSLAGPMNNARLEDSLDRFRQLDFNIREFTRRHNHSGDMIIDIYSGKFRFVLEENTEPVFLWQLPSKHSVSQFLLKDQKCYGGVLSIHYSEMGISPSFAVVFKNSKNEMAGMLFSGISGQTTKFYKTDEINGFWKILDEDE